MIVLEPAELNFFPPSLPNSGGRLPGNLTRIISLDLSKVGNRQRVINRALAETRHRAVTVG